MKYFSPVMIGLVALMSSFLYPALRPVPSDSVDEFFFSFEPEAAADTDASLSERQVSEILAERMESLHFSKPRIRALARHLVSLCRYYQFDPVSILSLIEVESGFRPEVVSPAGAVGLMQIMPATAQWMATRMAEELDQHIPGTMPLARRTLLGHGLRRALKDPFTSASLGMAYLSYLKQLYRQNGDSVLAAYNVGPARFEELRSRKKRGSGTTTQKYIDAIRRGEPRFRGLLRS